LAARVSQPVGFKRHGLYTMRLKQPVLYAMDAKMQAFAAGEKSWPKH